MTIWLSCTSTVLGMNSRTVQKISPEAPLTNVENPFFQNVNFRQTCPLWMTKLFHLGASKKKLNKTERSAVSTDTTTHCSGETRSQFPGNSSGAKTAPTCAHRWILKREIFFHARYKIKSDQVLVLSHASVLKVGSEMTFISAFPWYIKKNKTLCIILFHTMQAIGTQGCVCRTDSWLARKADTWYRWLYKKGHVSKNTQALPFSSKWLQPHYSTRSLWVFVQYTTLRANPSFFFFFFIVVFFHKSFFLSCNKHIWYNRSTPGAVCGLVTASGEDQEDPATISLPPSVPLQVLVAAGGVARTHTAARSMSCWD